MRVLLVNVPGCESAAIVQGIRSRGAAVDLAATNAQGYRRAAKTDYDAILLGLFRAPPDDAAAIQRWRRRAMGAGILALTPGRDVAQTVRVIESGADDCLAAPFHLDELLARLLGLFRRRHRQHAPVCRIHDLEIDAAARTVRRAGQAIHLTPREFALLQFLAFHRGTVVTRGMILEHVYGQADENTSNVVDVYIRYLRSKIDKDCSKPLILTRWGLGYMLLGDD